MQNYISQSTGKYQLEAELGPAQPQLVHLFSLSLLFFAGTEFVTNLWYRNWMHFSQKQMKILSKKCPKLEFQTKPVKFGTF